MSDAFEPSVSKVSAEFDDALVRAQQNFEPARKTSTNPAFRSKYADLGAVLDACVPALNAEGIFFHQRSRFCDNGSIIETVVRYKGMERSMGEVFIPASKHDAHGHGSAESYARRYGALLLGIAPQEDDGNAAAKSSEIAEQKRQTLMRKVAAAASAKFDADDVAGAFEEWQSLKENDDKKDAWYMFTPTTVPESTMRSALKKFGEEMRKRDAEISKMPAAV